MTAIIGLMVGGVWICVARQGYHISDDELPLLEFVRQTRRQGDLYLIPVNVPAQADSPRGTPSSSDFKPLAAKKRDALVIPVDLQRFRLATGVPIFVDFKAIPYKDTDVLEWYKRLRFAELPATNAGRTPGRHTGGAAAAADHAPCCPGCRGLEVGRHRAGLC